jgi:uncharacterized Ntn-hydrolase superfamily protein
VRRLALCLAVLVIAIPTRGVERPTHTYSIVARDPATGQLGVAVQSHWFSVGSMVSWAEAGVGAVATQSFVDPAYGPRGLELMRGGLSPGQALAALTSVDDGRRSARSPSSTRGPGRRHTGARCIGEAGHHVGVGYSVQANMMLNDRVVPAMAAAYEAATADLAERMMQALEAAERAGGDIRGRQSAAMLIVNGVSTGRPWADRVLELRVEDHPDPLAELRRLITVQRLRAQNAGDLAVERATSPSPRRSTRQPPLLPGLEVNAGPRSRLATVGSSSGAAGLPRDLRR